MSEELTGIQTGADQAAENVIYDEKNIRHLSGRRNVFPIRMKYSPTCCIIFIMQKFCLFSVFAPVYGHKTPKFN